MKKLAIASGLVLAMGIATGAQAHPDNSGYWDESPTSTVWKTGFGECWRHGFWADGNAIEGCTGYQAPAAPAAKPMAKSVVEKHIVYFDFDSSNPGDVSDISDYIKSLKEVSSVNLVGHADRIGASAYNDALSQKRVNAVSDALQGAGVSGSAISTGYMGENAPAKSCDGQSGANLIDCLRANRRVEVEISGKK